MFGVDVGLGGTGVGRLVIVIYSRSLKFVCTTAAHVAHFPKSLTFCHTTRRQHFASEILNEQTIKWLRMDADEHG